LGVDERTAIARLKRGDIGGLEPLVRAWQLPAVRTAYLITRDRGMAEDITQTAFIRAYERIAQFDDARPFGPWFLRIVANDASKAAARLRRFVPFEQPDLAGVDGAPVREWPDAAPGPEDLLEAAETRQAMWAALGTLPPAQQEAVVLRYYLELDVNDVAERLGVAPGTAKWRLHAARKHLQRALGAILPGRGSPPPSLLDSDAVPHPESEGTR
jgi:RNA polymerase sigma-70 factor (ECF subfamily)